tara:strand:+ start:212 stop:568 length:357 start_codon:yes stop_codon:yes gene_type:complete
MGWIAPVAPEVARAAHAAVVDKFRIHCAFQQKDEAKALGALWSATHKTWYAPNQETYDQLVQWHKPVDKPQKTIDKRSPTKKLKKCPEPPPAPKKAPRPPQELRVWAESVPIFGLDPV